MFASDLTQDPATIRFADLDQHSQRIEGRENVARLLGDKGEMIILSVVGERDAKTIDPAGLRSAKPRLF